MEDTSNQTTLEALDSQKQKLVAAQHPGSDAVRFVPTPTYINFPDGSDFFDLPKEYIRNVIATQVKKDLASAAEGKIPSNLVDSIPRVNYRDERRLESHLELANTIFVEPNGKPTVFFEDTDKNTQSKLTRLAKVLCDIRTYRQEKTVEAKHMATPPSRIIRAVYDDATIRVYQAYNSAIADVAVETQSFQVAMEMGLWSPKRMTWIKPSKVWMAYRCGWTVLKDSNQERVLALDLDRTKFEELLAKATLSHDKKCRNRSVVVQWDPERVIAPQAPAHQVATKPLDSVRSIQIGLRSPANRSLLDPETVVRITDVTQDFRSALTAMEEGQDIDQVKALLWPGEQTEQALAVPACVEENLRMTRSQKVDEAASKKRQAVVVLGCTANPPHQGHLHCIKAAHAHAETVGYNVLFSTIAVAPFGYVKSKSKRACSSPIFDDQARLTVLEMMAAGMADEDESFCFQVPTRTYGSALQCGRALRPSPEVTVIVVVGGDRFNWNKRCHSDLVTLGCARSVEQYSELKEKLDHDIQTGKLSGAAQKWQVVSAVGPATSSTRIRDILASNASLGKKQTLLMEVGYPNEAAEVLLNSGIRNGSNPQ